MAAGKYDDERDVAMAVEAGEGVLALCAGSKRERDEDVETKGDATPDVVVEKPAKKPRKARPGQLRFAALRGNIQRMKDLLEAGADPDEEDDMGATPLHAACRAGHLEAVKLLVSAECRMCDDDANSRTPLQYAVKAGVPDIVSYLVSNMSKDMVNHCDAKGNTAMHVAAMRLRYTHDDTAYKAIIKCLLQGGASLHRRNNADRIPLDLVPPHAPPSAAIKTITKATRLDKYY
jgi:ankyrin repeat protein